MARRSLIFGCSVLACLSSATLASAAAKSLLGKSFVVKDSSAGTDPTRRRLVAIAKEKASSVPVFGDPTIDGAALAVEVDSMGQIVDLPANQWRAVPGGFRYDRGGEEGPVESAVVRLGRRGTFTLKAVLSGAHGPLALVPPNPGRESGFGIVIRNALTYCAHFGGVAGGTVVNDGARLFAVKRPTATGPCPSGVQPTTPPTISSTTTSTTTTTTLVGPACGDVQGPPSCWGVRPPETRNTRAPDGTRLRNDTPAEV